MAPVIKNKAFKNKALQDEIVMSEEELRDLESNGSEHPFAGCNRLLGQYKIIGSSLIDLKRSLHYYSNNPTSTSLSNFQISVSFIATEVLASYREDLFDPEISGDKLFIEEDTKTFHIPLYSLLGVCASICLGMFIASLGISFFWSLITTLVFSSPFLAIWHYFPKEESLLRLRFAAWLADEIDRRLGKSGTSSKRRSSDEVISPFFFPNSTGVMPGSAAGTAFLYNFQPVSVSDQPVRRPSRRQLKKQLPLSLRKNRLYH